MKIQPLKVGPTVPKKNLNYDPETEKLIEELDKGAEYKPSFNGFNCEAKTLYKKGLLPMLKKDIYGHEIKKATTEHIKPRSKGGKTTLGNTVVCDSESNNNRGDKPLVDFIDFKAFADYCEIFRNRIFGKLNGNQYIAELMKTVSECLQKGL